MDGYEFVDVNTQRGKRVSVGRRKANDKISPHDNGEITISGLNEEEMDRIEGVLRGHWYMTGQKDQLSFLPTHKPMPSPVEDPELAPFWQREHLRPWQQDLPFPEVAFEKLPGWSSPHITIQSLCGYYYTVANYALAASRLESYGFQCLRSRPGDDGRHTEIWYLPGLWAAKGELAEHIGEEKWSHSSKLLRKALDFISCHVLFGTLDVSIQKMAMPVPD